MDSLAPFPLERTWAARHAISSGEFGSAVLCMLEALRAPRSPADDAFISLQLPQALYVFGHQLVGLGQADRALWLWDTSLRLTSDPSAVALLRYHYARFLFSIRYLIESAEQYTLCSKADRSMHLRCFEDIENVKSLIIDRWHFRMLNDRVRNACYASAITGAIAQFRRRHGKPPVVLDIGGGTGLLSMFAAREAVDKIYCCEMSPEMCKIAMKCIRLNGYQNVIQVIQKHSRDVIIGKDMRCRADLIVTELMDAGLVGEHILPTLWDARERLLAPGGQVIPHAARLRGIVIDCPEIRKRQVMLAPSLSDYIEDEKGRQSSFCFANAAFKVLSLFNSCLPDTLCIADKPKRRFVVDETYTCDQFKSLSADRLTLSPVLDLGWVALDGSLGAAAAAAWRARADFRALHAGSVDALVYWYDISTCMTDSGSSFQFSTAPSCDIEAQLLPRSLGWDQAIRFLGRDSIQAGSGFFKQIEKNELTELVVSLNSENNIFLVDCNSEGDAESEKEKDLIPANETCTIRLGEMDIRMLNDWVRIELYLSALFNSILFANLDSACRLFFVELSGNWLSFASVAMTLLRDLVSTGSEWAAGDFNIKAHEISKSIESIEAAVFCPSEESACTVGEEFLLLSASTIENRFATEGFARHGSFYDHCRTDLINRLQIGFTNANYFFLICDIVEGNGLIRQGCLRDIQCFWRKLPIGTAVENIRTVPESVGVVLSLVQWKDLYNSSYAGLDATIGIKVQDEVNKYKSSVLREIDFRDLNKMTCESSSGESDDTNRYLSDPVELFNFRLSDIRSDSNAEQGMEMDDAIIRTERFVLRASTNGVVHAISIWYNLYLLRAAPGMCECLLSTGPLLKDKNSSHYRQVAFLLQEPLAVTAGQCVEVELVIHAVSGVICTLC